MNDPDPNPAPPVPAITPDEPAPAVGEAVPDAAPAAADAAPDAAVVPAATEPVAPEPAAAPATAELSPAACAARLAELFPAVFTPGKPAPLKLRIQADIQQRAPGQFTKRSLSAFLHRHTTGNAYLRAMVAAPARIDLDGQPAGEVSAEHRDAAQAELERRRAIVEARRAAERAAQQEARQAARHDARQAERQVQRERAVDDAARRERQALVRAWETTTLTRANFLVLKGLTAQQLDAALAAAAQDREAAPPPRHPPPVERARPSAGERPRSPAGERPSAAAGERPRPFRPARGAPRPRS